MVSHYLTRTEVLKRIRDELNSMKQWQSSPANVDFVVNAARYAQKAEGLIELLEIHDCGSVGGFGNGHTGSHDLETRYLWLTEVKVERSDE